MSEKDLQQRLDQIKPTKSNMNPGPDEKLIKSIYTVDIAATEKQMDHLKSHMRMMKIKFQVKEQ